MPDESWGEFANRLEREGELIRVSEPVDTELEISELASRQMKSPGGGKALLFERPVREGRVSAFPVLINAFGSERRMALALGLGRIGELAERVAGFLQARPPRSIREGWDLLARGLDLWKSRPVTVSSGACQEVVYLFKEGDSFSLADLPVLKCWPEDGGRFLTLPCVYTVDPSGGVRNVGMYRMQEYDGRTTGMHWQLHKMGARHYDEYARQKRPMPVAVCLGGDPTLTFSAVAPLPDRIDEVLLAGFLRKQPVEMVRCLTCDLEVPACSDFVIEGYVEPGETRPEGPFGDHTGFYTSVEDYPVFHVKAITHRRGAVYPATVVGRPPMEDYYLGMACTSLLLPLLKAMLPEVVDVHMPPEGVFHNLLFVSIRKQYPYQAYKVMHGLWGMGQMMFSKIVVVVDEDIDVRNTAEVLWWLGASVDPQRDIVVTRGPADSLDHAPDMIHVGSKAGIDATRKLPGEGFSHRPWPRKIEMDRRTRDTVDGLLEKMRNAPGAGGFQMGGGRP